VKARSTPVKVRAYIYLCLDLPAADKTGSSDPFIEVWDTVAEVKKTQVVEDNNNPLFYETLELDYEVDKMDDLESYPPFIFDVYDHDDDLFDSTPDFLGRAIIEPEDCAIKMFDGQIKHLKKERDYFSPEERLKLQFEYCHLHNLKNCD
jgi:Ca2+-dependent lipid-binding protein